MASVFLFSCSFLKEKKENPIDSNVRNGSEIQKGLKNDSTLYGFNEKYGFGEMCWRNRTLAIARSEYVFSKNLPISDDDLKVLELNYFSSFKNDTILANRFNKNVNSDIRLDVSEYLSDATLEIGLVLGTYEIEKKQFSTILRIRDDNSGRVLIQKKWCDGF